MTRTKTVSVIAAVFVVVAVSLVILSGSVLETSGDSDSYVGRQIAASQIPIDQTIDASWTSQPAITSLDLEEGLRARIANDFSLEGASVKRVAVTQDQGSNGTRVASVDLVVSDHAAAAEGVSMNWFRMLPRSEPTAR